MFKGSNIPDDGRFEKAIKVEAVNGACFVVRRDAFEAIGGFDPAYPLHFEDLDLFARLQNKGHHLLFDGRVEVTHLHGHSEQNQGKIKQWKKQGLKRYMSKHRPWWEAQVVKLFLF